MPGYAYELKGAVTLEDNSSAAWLKITQEVERFQSVAQAAARVTTGLEGAVKNIATQGATGSLTALSSSVSATVRSVEELRTALTQRVGASTFAQPLDQLAAIRSQVAGLRSNLTSTNLAPNIQTSGYDRAIAAIDALGVAAENAQLSFAGIEEAQEGLVASFEALPIGRSKDAEKQEGALAESIVATTDDLKDQIAAYVKRGEVGAKGITAKAETSGLKEAQADAALLTSRVGLISEAFVSMQRITATMPLSGTKLAEAGLTALQAGILRATASYQRMLAETSAPALAGLAASDGQIAAVVSGLTGVSRAYSAMQAITAIGALRGAQAGVQLIDRLTAGIARIGVAYESMQAATAGAALTGVNKAEGGVKALDGAVNKLGAAYATVEKLNKLAFVVGTDVTIARIKAVQAEVQGIATAYRVVQGVTSAGAFVGLKSAQAGIGALQAGIGAATAAYERLRAAGSGPLPQLIGPAFSAGIKAAQAGIGALESGMARLSSAYNSLTQRTASRTLTGLEKATASLDSLETRLSRIRVVYEGVRAVTGAGLAVGTLTGLAGVKALTLGIEGIGVAYKATQLATTGAAATGVGLSIAGVKGLSLAVEGLAKVYEGVRARTAQPLLTGLALARVDPKTYEQGIEGIGRAYSALRAVTSLAAFTGIKTGEAGIKTLEATIRGATRTYEAMRSQGQVSPVADTALSASVKAAESGVRALESGITRVKTAYASMQQTTSADVMAGVRQAAAETTSLTLGIQAVGKAYAAMQAVAQATPALAALAAQKAGATELARALQDAARTYQGLREAQVVPVGAQDGAQRSLSTLPLLLATVTVASQKSSQALQRTFADMQAGMYRAMGINTELMRGQAQWGSAAKSPVYSLENTGLADIAKKRTGPSGVDWQGLISELMGVTQAANAATSAYGSFKNAAKGDPLAAIAGLTSLVGVITAATRGVEALRKAWGERGGPEGRLARDLEVAGKLRAEIAALEKQGKPTEAPRAKLAGLENEAAQLQGYIAAQKDSLALLATMQDEQARLQAKIAARPKDTGLVEDKKRVADLDAAIKQLTADLQALGVIKTPSVSEQLAQAKQMEQALGQRIRTQGPTEASPAMVQAWQGAQASVAQLSAMQDAITSNTIEKRIEALREREAALAQKVAARPADDNLLRMQMELRDVQGELRGALALQRELGRGPAPEGMQAYLAYLKRARADLVNAYRANPAAFTMQQATEKRSIEGEIASVKAEQKSLAQEGAGPLATLARGWNTVQGSVLGVYAALGIAGMVIGTVQRVWREALSEIREGLRELGVERNFTKLAESAGIAANDIRKQMSDAVKGTIDDTDMMSASSRSMLTRNQNVIAALPRLMEAARAAAKATGRDTLDVYQTLQMGIIRAAPRLIDSAGLYMNTSQALRAYAREVGKSTQELSRAEKQTVLVNAVTEKSQQLIETLGSTNESTADKFKKLGVAQNEYNEALRKSAANSGVVKWLAGVGAAMAEGMGSTTELINRQREIDTAIEEAKQQAAYKTTAAYREQVDAIERSYYAARRVQGTSSIVQKAGNLPGVPQELVNRYNEETKAQDKLQDAYQRTTTQLQRLKLTQMDWFERRRGLKGLEEEDEELQHYNQLVEQADASTRGLLGVQEKLAAITNAAKQGAYLVANPDSQLPSVGKNVLDQDLAAWQRFTDWVSDHYAGNTDVQQWADDTTYAIKKLTEAQSQYLAKAMAAGNLRSTLDILAQGYIDVRARAEDLFSLYQQDVAKPGAALAPWFRKIMDELLAGGHDLDLMVDIALEKAQRLDAVREKLATGTAKLVQMPKPGQPNLTEDMPLPATPAGDFGPTQRWLDTLMRANEAARPLAAHVLGQVNAYAEWQRQIVKTANAMDDAAAAGQYLAQSFIGLDGDVLKLIAGFEQMPESLRRSINQIKLFDAAVAAMRAQAAKPVTVQAKLAGLQQSLGSIDQASLGLIGIMPESQIQTMRDAAIQTTETAYRRLGETNEYGLKALNAKVAESFQTQVSIYAQYYAQIEAAQRAHNERMKDSAANIKERIQGILTASVQVTGEDALNTQLGKYKDKALENVRRLRAVQEYGRQGVSDLKKSGVDILSLFPELQPFMGLDPREEEKLKLEAQRQADMLERGVHPRQMQLTNVPGAVQAYQEKVKEEESQKAYLDSLLAQMPEITPADREKIRADILKAWGLEEPKVTFEAMLTAEDTARAELEKQVGLVHLQAQLHAIGLDLDKYGNVTLGANFDTAIQNQPTRARETRGARYGEAEAYFEEHGEMPDWWVKEQQKSANPSPEKGVEQMVTLKSDKDVWGLLGVTKDQPLTVAVQFVGQGAQPAPQPAAQAGPQAGPVILPAPAQPQAFPALIAPPIQAPVAPDLAPAGAQMAASLQAGYNTALADFHPGATLVTAMSQDLGTYSALFDGFGTGFGQATAGAFRKAVIDNVGSIRRDLAALIAPEVASMLNIPAPGTRPK